ncbi:MAG: transposase family protein [Gammaproteobacteria bacterium]|nr:transposase family protein [Gammaproteobacteria bacterium]
MLLPTFLGTIPDHRRPQGRWYGLEHLVLFSILAILSDAMSYRKIQRFIEARLAPLNAPCGLRWTREAPGGPHTAIRYALPGRCRGGLSGSRVVLGTGDGVKS